MMKKNLEVYWNQDQYRRLCHHGQTNIESTRSEVKYPALHYMGVQQDSKYYIPSNDDSMWFLRNLGQSDDQTIWLSVLRHDHHDNRRDEIRNQRQELYSGSSELHRANQIRINLLQAREQFEAEMVQGMKRPRSEIVIRYVHR